MSVWLGRRSDEKMVELDRFLFRPAKFHPPNLEKKKRGRREEADDKLPFYPPLLLPIV